MSDDIFFAIRLAGPRRVMTRLLFIPKGVSGKQRCRKDARWVLPSCTSARCSHVVSRARREADQTRGVAEGSLYLLRCFDSRISQPWCWKNKGLLGSRPTRGEGLPPCREAEAAAPGEVAEAADAASWLRAPGRAPTLPTSTAARRASALQIPAPSRPPPPPPPLLPHGSVSERNFLLGRPLRGPRVCGGEGARGRPAGSSPSSAPRRVESTPAPAPGARPPLPTPRRVAAPEPPRPRGPSVRGSGASACSFLAWRWGGGGSGRAGAAAPPAGRGGPGRWAAVGAPPPRGLGSLAPPAAAGEAVRSYGPLLVPCLSGPSERSTARAPTPVGHTPERQPGCCEECGRPGPAARTRERASPGGGV